MHANVLFLFSDFLQGYTETVLLSVTACECVCIHVRTHACIKKTETWILYK